MLEYISYQIVLSFSVFESEDPPSPGLRKRPLQFWIRILLLICQESWSNGLVENFYGTLNKFFDILVIVEVLWIFFFMFLQSQRDVTTVRNLMKRGNCPGWTLSLRKIFVIFFIWLHIPKWRGVFCQRWRPKNW